MTDQFGRITCRCGKGKVSAYDGKCGHCRNKREKEAHSRMVDPERWASLREYWTLRRKAERTAR